MKYHIHGGLGCVEKEMGNLDECDMEAFGRLFEECSVETISILGDRL